MSTQHETPKNQAEVWKNERPQWCPEQSCIFKRRAQDAFCGGVLPEPRPHDNDLNDFNLCFNGDGTVERYEMNKSDFWWLKRVMDGVQQ